MCTRDDLTQGDSFRQAVAAWAKPAGKAMEIDLGKQKERAARAQRAARREEDRVRRHGQATPEEQKAVTD